MSTTNVAVSTAKKSKSSSNLKSANDFSARNNPTKNAEGVSSSKNPGIHSSPNAMGAFYSSGPVTSISPAIQAKFVQQKSESTDDEVESSEENTMNPASESDDVQFMCSEYEAEEQGTDQVQEKDEYQDQVQEKEESEDEPVQLENVQSQMEAENADEGESAAEGEGSDVGDDSAVQMWSCDDHEKPTCSYQAKEDGSTLVQFMCAECDAEENAEAHREQGAEQEEEQEQVQSKSTEAAEMEDKAGQDKVGEDPVQQKCSSCESEEDPVQHKSNKKYKGKSSVLKDAGEGLQNAQSPLPHSDTIQSSFGHHDVSNIRSEVGGSAGRASERMGALAYASADRIGFRHSPGLHLAAHEAAHTVQQRSGLKLPGNVGRPGDQWETHADRVADKVVAGESAEPLLDAVAPVPALSATPLPAKPAPTSAGGANGDGISGAVQRSITSGATHHEESELAEEGGGAEGEGEGTAGGEGGAEGEGATEEGASEASVEPEEEEADPAADCAKAEDDDNDNEDETEENSEGSGEQASAEQPPSGSQKGRCYNASTKNPPPGSEEPSDDAPGNDVDAEADVDYGTWEETNDVCECAAKGTLPPNAARATVQQEGPAAAEESGGAGAEAEGASAEATETLSSAENNGGGGGGESEGGGESSKGNFAQGEASRDASMAEFDAATGEVSRVPTRAAKLSNGLRFGDSASGDAAQEASRAAALNQIRAFMQNATAQIEEAVAYVRDEVPMQLRGKAESVKAEIDMSMIDEKSAISARVDDARSAAADEAGNASAAIIGEYENSVATVNTESDAAIQALNEAYATNTDAVTAREQTALSEVNTRFATGRADHEAKGVLFANAAIATGQEWVESFDHCRSDSGNDYEYNGDDGTWDGCLTVRRAKAQQESSCKTASGMAENMIDISKKKGFELREQRTQRRCTVITGAGEAQTALSSAIEGHTAGIEQGRAGSLSGLEQMRDLNLTAVKNALKATQKSLDKQERDQRQAVNDSGYVQQVAVEQMAHQVATGLVQGVSSAMESLEQTLEELREKLLQGGAPEPEQLDEILANAEEGLGGGVGTLLDKMMEGATDAQNSLAEAGMSAAAALGEISSGNNTLSSTAESGFASEMSTLVGSASDSMAQVTEGHVSNAQEAATTGTEGMVQVATGFVETTERIYTESTAAINTSLGELNAELINMAEGLEGKIAGEAWRAASKEQPAWKGVVAIVLIIIIIIVSIIVTALTAGAAAAALGPILGALLLGAVVGAVSAGLIQVISNWAAGDDLTKGLVQAIVMGAVGGAIGGGIGAGANGLAQVGVNAAIRTTSSTLTRAAINVGVNLAGDMVAEGATQAIGYYAFGQKFNWQGFVTAGAMSVASTARGAGGVAGKVDADASIGGMFRPTGVSGPRPTLRAPTATDAAIGLGVGGALEGINYLATGEFDAKRLATTVAGAGGGSWAAGLSRNRAGAGGGGETPSGTTPRSAAPEVEAPTTPRPAAPEVEAPTTPRPAASGVEAATTPRPAAPEVEAPTTTPRPSAPDTEAPAAEAPAAATTRAVEPDAELPAAVKSQSDSEPAAPTVRGEAEGDANTTRPAGEEGADATTSRPSAEGEAPAKRPVDADSEPAPTRAAHDDSPEIEPGVVARIDIGDGHSITILKDGRVIVCSACGDIRMKYASELADPLNVAHRNELSRIEGMTDPRAKALAAEQFQKSMEVVRRSGISHAPADATDGASIARAADMADAPSGYHWAIEGGGIAIKRNPGGVEANNPPVRYDSETRSFVPDIKAPEGYHWTPKPQGGFALAPNPGQSPNLPKLEYDGPRGRIIDPATGAVYQKPLAQGQRPTWAESEVNVGNRLGSGYTDQVSFKGGDPKPVPHGTPGSTRPDHYSPGPPRHSVEVKNYGVETPAGRSALVRDVTVQAKGRQAILPPGTRQSLYIDVRGQDISQAQMDSLAQSIASNSGGTLSVSNITFIQ